MVSCRYKGEVSQVGANRNKERGAAFRATEHVGREAIRGKWTWSHLSSKCLLLNSRHTQNILAR